MTKIGKGNYATESSFGNLAMEWLDSLKPRLKKSSIVKYTNILRLYLMPEYQEWHISDIGRRNIVEFSNRLLTEGGTRKKGLSPKSVTGIISVAKNVFEYASQEKGYHVADIKNISVKHPQKFMRVLSHMEQQRLNNYLYQNLTPCSIGILLCLYTGLRIGEICALKWEDIFFDDQYLYVHKTMQRLQTEAADGERKTAIFITTPKSSCSIRRIPIPDGLLQLLSANRYPDNTYFLTGLSNRYMEPRTMQNRFQAITAQCGISDVHFHTLRHTFATRCIEMGFDVKSLSEILGHATVNITMNRYVHPSMELKQKNMNMLCCLFNVR